MVPEGASANALGVITIGNRCCCFSVKYQPPRILSVGTVPENGGMLDISGVNFGPAGQLIHVRIGSLPPRRAVLVRPHRKLQVWVPDMATTTAGSAHRSIPIQVEVAGQ